MMQVPIKKIDPMTMYLKQEVAEGEYGDIKFTVCSTIPGGSLLLNDGKDTYMLTVEDFVEAVLDIKGQES